MKIYGKQFTVRQIVEGYKNNEEEGVFAFGGLLNIRPPYQREFVYDDKKRNAVIDTIRRGFPLNVMYWSKNEDGTFGVIDGQQRTISFCEYISGMQYSIDGVYFDRLTEDEQEEILDYTLDIFVCEGSDKERLEWFRTINIAGEKLNDQELLNANYTGPWLTDAKRRFSKTNCVAYKLGSKYVKGTPIRQDYLETALDWISGGFIEDYMRAHQHDANSDELWLYFQKVIAWVESIFNYRKEMLGLPWGRLYNVYHENKYDKDFIEEMVSMLMSDDEITNKKGIYDYIFTQDEKSLSLRTFSDREKRTMYEKQKGIDPVDGLHYELSEMEAHHITEWTDGGKTILENCVMVSKKNHKNIYAKLTPDELRERRDNLINQ